MVYEQEVYGLVPLQDTVDVALLISCLSFIFCYYFTYPSPCVLFILKTIHAYKAVYIKENEKLKSA